MNMMLSDLRDSARGKADEESTGFVSNTELNRYLNQGQRLIYGKISSRFESYFIKKGFSETIATTSVDTTTDRITVANVYATGDPVVYSGTGTVIGGLTSGTTYYAIYVSDTVIKLATTAANAAAGTAIDLTSVGTATHTLYNGQFDTVANTQGYSLPVGMLRHVRVEYRQTNSTSENDWRKIPTLNIATDQGSSYYPIREGYLPQFGYFIAGDKLWLKPVPSQAFSVRSWFVPKVIDLVNDSDVPSIPSEYHELIAEYAAIQMLRKSGEAIFSESMTVFNIELNNLLETIEYRNQEPEQMVITEDSDKFRYGW